MPEAPSFSSALSDLVDALTASGVDYALIGGFAVIVHGYDRSTRDVDLVAWNVDDNIEDLVASLDERGFTFRSGGIDEARQIRVLRMAHRTGIPIDISMGLLPFEHEVVERASDVGLGGDLVARIATVEDLVIMKLIASRPRDLDDITRLLELHPSQDRARIRRIVKEFAEALDDPEILKNLSERIG